jgi:hypothetical protein
MMYFPVIVASKNIGGHPLHLAVTGLVNRKLVALCQKRDFACLPLPVAWRSSGTAVSPQFSNAPRPTAAHAGKRAGTDAIAAVPRDNKKGELRLTLASRAD